MKVMETMKKENQPMTTTQNICEKKQGPQELTLTRKYEDGMCSPKSLDLICENITTPQQAFKSNFINLYGLEKQFGYNKAELILSAHIIALNKFLNQSQQMTVEQIDFVVQQLLRDECFKWLNMAELNLIIRRIKTSYYGKLYNSFDSMKFFEILRDYDSERTMAIEQVHITENSQHRGTMKNAFDYVKLKRDGEERQKQLNDEQHRREDEIAIAREKNMRMTAEVKRIVDAKHIDDPDEYKREYDKVFSELLLKGGVL